MILKLFYYKKNLLLVLKGLQILSFAGPTHHMCEQGKNYQIFMSFSD